MTSSRHLVLITGATRGLGRLVAQKFWQDGNDIILIARSDADLKKTACELTESFRCKQDIQTFSADLSKIDILPSLIKKIQTTVGNPDIIINNAAIQGPIGPVHMNDWEEWKTCLDICLLAPVQICRGFLPTMIERKYGRIINISGGGATAPRVNFSSYATAKCGLVRFSETLAGEVSQYNITVNCVAPGVMKSNLTKDILRAGKQNAGNSEFETALKLSEIDPHSEERASELVHFLTTDACNSITGKLISAIWDRWEKMPDAAPALMNNDVYTLRRILPQERNIHLE